MRPSIRIRLSAADHVVLSTWRKRVFAVYALLAATLIGYLALTPGTRTIAQGVSKDEQARVETCLNTGTVSDAADAKCPDRSPSKTR
jgi:hypothetical protein